MGSMNSMKITANIEETDAIRTLVFVNKVLKVIFFTTPSYDPYTFLSAYGLFKRFGINDICSKSGIAIIAAVQ